MYSQCPDCLARFRITAAQLRAAHGTVRCGRCGGAFDALVRLSDTLPAIEPVDEAALLEERDDLPAAAASGVPPEYHFSAADLEKVFIEARDWAPPAAGPTQPPPDLDPEPLLLVDEPERVEDITLEGEKVAIEDAGADEFDATSLADDGTATPLDFDLSDTSEAAALDVEFDEDDTTSRLRALRDQPASAPVVHTDEPVHAAGKDPEQEPASPPLARDWPPPARPRGTPSPATSAAATSAAMAAERWSSAPRETQVDFDALEPEQPASHRSLAWTVGTALLALLLFAQITHHYRAQLLRQPSFGPALRAVYERLGIPVSGAWDVNAYEIRQWGAADAARVDGQLNVRASVTNRASFAQPLPLLRLEIEDRFGEGVAIRDFEPREYLSDPARSSRMLAAGEAADAELDVVAPGSDAVGYRLNVCMRDSDRSVHCATTAG
jgi:predicted Zn finger-like uncharacterized protein